MIDQSIKGFMTRLFSASQVAVQYMMLMLAIAKQNIYMLYLTLWTIVKSFILFYPKQLFIIKQMANNKWKQPDKVLLYRELFILYRRPYEWQSPN